MSIKLVVTRITSCPHCPPPPQYCGHCDGRGQLEECIPLEAALAVLGVPTKHQWAYTQRLTQLLAEKTLALETQLCELRADLRQQLQELAEPLL